jgi:hypothetical protein
MNTAISAATDVKGVISALLTLTQKLGRTTFVVTARGDEVKTAFKVVEATSLIISNTLDGRINPNFPQELQPRDRTRMTSLLQVRKIANELRPAQLTDSGLSSHGAPIIGPDQVVESGNGRSMGILKAYAEGSASSYRQFLIANASAYGLNDTDISAMNAPVLVRVRLDAVDRAQFAKDSNMSDLQEMAASEKAWLDAESIDTELMAAFQPSEGGNLLARSNQAFVQGFMKALGDTATAGLVTPDGRPTKQLVDRMQNAIFAKAYRNERLVRLVAEEPDPEIRNVLTAMNMAAPDFVEMQYLSGEVHKQVVSSLADSVETLDKKAMNALVEATELVRSAKYSGQSIDEIVRQKGLFGDVAPETAVLAMFIIRNNRSAKRMGEAFKILAKEINNQLLKSGSAVGDMFGGDEMTFADVIAAADRELEHALGLESLTVDLF